MVERTVYPSAGGELIAELPPDTVSHTVAPEESGVLFADAQHIIDLCRADDEDARLLGCRPGDPLLRERRCSTDPAGTPIEWSEDRYLPETVAFTVHSSAASGSPPGRRHLSRTCWSVVGQPFRSKAVSSGRKCAKSGVGASGSLPSSSQRRTATPSAA